MKTNTCVIIDDEKRAREITSRYVARLEWLELPGEFGDPIKALHILLGSSVDLIFLDINMPTKYGIDFIKSLNQNEQVVITSVTLKYAIDGFECNVLHHHLNQFVLRDSSKQ